MAETQKASTGHRSQFWLHDGVALVRCMEVKSIKFPTAERGEQPSTHLDSDAEEYVPTLPDYGDFEVVLNHRDGSDTDVLLAAAFADPDERDFKIVLANRGALVTDSTGAAILKRYELPELTVDTVQESTAIFRMTGAVTKAAHV